jgi:hypothetical protein
MTPLAANAMAAPLLEAPGATDLPLLLSASLIESSIQFEPSVLAESGEGFKTGAKLVNVELRWPGLVKSAEIPQLNSPAVKDAGKQYSGFKTETQALPLFSLKLGKIIRLTTLFSAPQSFSFAKAAFSRPINVRSENIEKTPKPLMMRYMLQLVKDSGENIRNLEIVGIYRIPKKGLQSLKHDSSTGALKITVGPEAQASKYCKLVLANKKNDRAKVSCTFDEE